MGGFADRFQFESSEPPEGIAIGNLALVREGAEIVLRSDAARVKPGQQGNLIVNILAGRPAASSRPANRPANNRRAAIGALPALLFEIVPP